jgi:hypothetical protein
MISVSKELKRPPASSALEVVLQAVSWPNGVEQVLQRAVGVHQ